jgi:hypothetical protein
LVFNRFVRLLGRVTGGFESGFGQIFKSLANAVLSKVRHKNQQETTMAPILEETPPTASESEAPSTPQPESQPLRPGVEIELSKPEPEPQPQGEVLDPEYDYAKGTPAAEPAKTHEELDSLSEEDWHRYNVRNAEAMKGLGKAAVKVSEKVKISVVAYLDKFYPNTVGGRPTNAVLANARLHGLYPTRKAYIAFLGLNQRTIGDWRAWTKGLLPGKPTAGRNIGDPKDTKSEDIIRNGLADLESEPEETDLEAARKFFTPVVKRELLATVQTRQVLKAALQMALDAFNKEYGPTAGICTMELHFLPVTPTKPDTTDELDKLNQAKTVGDLNLEETATTAPSDKDKVVGKFSTLPTYGEIKAAQAARAETAEPATTPEPPHYTVRFDEGHNEYQILTRTGKVYDVRKSKEKADKLCAKLNQEREAHQALVTA